MIPYSATLLCEHYLVIDKNIKKKTKKSWATFSVLSHAMLFLYSLKIALGSSAMH